MFGALCGDSTAMWLSDYPLLREIACSFKEVAQHWFLFIVLFGVVILGMLGIVGKGLGLHNIFHDDRDMIETHYRNVAAGSRTHEWSVYWNSAALFTQFSLAILIALIWGFAYTLGPDHTAPGGPIENIYKSVGPQVLIFTAISVAVAIVSPKAPHSRAPFEWLRAIIGAVAGLAFAAFMFALALQLTQLLGESLDNAPTYGLALAASFVIGFVGWWQRLLPCIALINLLAAFAVAYALLATLPDPSHLGTMLLLALLILVLSGKFPRQGQQAPLLKFSFDGVHIGDEPDPYLPDKRLRLDKRYISRQERRDARRTQIDPFEALKGWRDGTWPPERTPSEDKAPEASTGKKEFHDSERFVRPIEALANWRAMHKEKPKLVLVATSGGAYRASFWTALVLDELVRRDQNNRIPGFAGNVRLITGASGGMVAAAYFAAMINAKGAHPTSVLGQIETDVFTTQDHANAGTTKFPYPSLYPIPRDSLSPVAQQLVQRDIPCLFDPRRKDIDRGVVLERQWTTLRRSFNSLIDGERAGWRPSLMFSPMIVETGQPLLITNLNLNRILADRSTEVALFFDWFPAAQNSFEVGTAVRMNASFPYVSPTTALPTIPSRRVVDAGYYDNYGIDLAVAYLADPEIRDWVIANTSGVAIIEIRAFPHAEPSDTDTSPVLAGFHWLTTPVEGMLSARGSTMTFRNRQSFARLQNTYDLALAANGGQSRRGAEFLRSFPFELDTDTSMNWYLPKHELADMVTFLASTANNHSFAELEAFWHC